MATFTITVTFTGTPAELTERANKLCRRWGYPGDFGDNSAKEAFLQQYVAKWIKSEFRDQHAEEAAVQSVYDVKAAALASTENVDIQ